MTKKGFISFVGAGPGNPEYLTLVGLKRIQEAKVILYDALLDPKFQTLFPETAIIEFVGKRSGNHSKSQEEINQLLVDFALKGYQIVRLKGGDPVIFGRVGEEIESISKHQIPFEIIPGVSALTTGIARYGQSLTNRGVSNQVLVISAHHAGEADRADIEWDFLAQFKGTIAIFMGSERMNYIAQKLIEHGASPNLPVLIVENASLETEIFHYVDLQKVAKNQVKKTTKGPALMYIGETLRHEYYHKL